MKVTRTYLSGCKWCGATGVVTAPFISSTSITDICPVCNGARTVIVTEVEEQIGESVRNDTTK